MCCALPFPLLMCGFVVKVFDASRFMCVSVTFGRSLKVGLINVGRDRANAQGCTAYLICWLPPVTVFTPP